MEMSRWAGVTWLVECCSVHLRVAGLIPGLGTYHSCRFDLWLRHIQEATYGCWEECQAEQEAENLCINMLLGVQFNYNVRYKQWTWAWKPSFYQVLQSLKAGLMSLYLNLSVLWYGQWRAITTEKSSLTRQKPKVYRMWLWTGGQMIQALSRAQSGWGLGSEFLYTKENTVFKSLP